MIYRKVTFETAREAYDFFDRLTWKPGAQVDGTSVSFFEGWNRGNDPLSNPSVPYTGSPNVLMVKEVKSDNTAYRR
jgi:hypothetical protein